MKLKGRKLKLETNGIESQYLHANQKKENILIRCIIWERILALAFSSIRCTHCGLLKLVSTYLNFSLKKSYFVVHQSGVEFPILLFVSNEIKI
jgi:hypothetical protein